MRLAAMCLVVALALPACARRQVAAPEPVPSAAASSPSAVPSAAPSAGVRIYIDPVTGETRAPSQAERAASAESAGTGAAAVKTAPGVTVTPLPGGVTGYDFGAPTQIDETVCVQADGSLRECSAAQAAKLRAGTKPGRQ